VANVGDSRVYRFRDARLEQLSVDDTASMQTVAADGRTPVERSVLVRAVGSERDVEVHLKEVELDEQDLLLLCSDGLHGYIPQEQIAALIGSPGPIAARTEALIAATRSAGAPDNVSAILLECRRG
jgi:protein phosphatase